MSNIPEGASQFFWHLDHEISAETREGYSGAMKRMKASRLQQTLGLVLEDVPIVPQAYLTKKCSGQSLERPSKEFLREVGAVIERLEWIASTDFGGGEKPLLLNLRGDFSGVVSAIGLNEETFPGLVGQVGFARATESYVRFLESFSTLVMGASFRSFYDDFGIERDRSGKVTGLHRFSEEEIKGFFVRFKEAVQDEVGEAFPSAVEDQLIWAILAMARKAADGTQDELFLEASIFPIFRGESTTGVVYTRDPFTGEHSFYGTFETDASGEKQPLEGGDTTLGTIAPTAAYQIRRHLRTVEAAFGHVVEAHFVSNFRGDVFFNAFVKAQQSVRSLAASLVELCEAGLVEPEEVISSIEPKDIETLLHPTLDEQSKASLEDLGSSGVAAAPGTAVGRVFFTMADAMAHRESQAKKGEKPDSLLLMTDELLISDTPGLAIVSGLCTYAAGIASHAAVMARANGLPCIVGYKGIEFASNRKSVKINGKTLKAGTWITLDASQDAKVYLGQGKVKRQSFQSGVVREISECVTRVLERSEAPLQVKCNINNGKDASVALAFGADGVGLVRTENMFMEPEALKHIRRFVFSKTPEKEAKSVSALEELQYEGFSKIFEVMQFRKVSIRLMDLPLHELAPQGKAELDDVAKDLEKVSRKELEERSEGLREHNPMLGLRACRFGIIQPEVYRMQLRAIFRAAYDVAKNGVVVQPAIMFPLVGSERELDRLREMVFEVHEEIRGDFAPSGEISLTVGSMIELPAAAMRADEMARVGEFFAFGTNDLTQTTLGISRDDSAKFLPYYLEQGILESDPFKVLADPVKELIETSVRRGRRVRPDASYGICGEQGGDPKTLEFCISTGLDYVSCSPYRVLPTRLALARYVLAVRDQIDEASRVVKRTIRLAARSKSRAA